MDGTGSLYHYTDFTALDGILGQAELRLNNVLNMNDASEMNLFMYSLCRSITDSFMAEDRQDLAGLTWSIFMEEQRSRFSYSAYAACFSRYRDDAAQWERYGNHGRGICIAFDQELLSQMATGALSLTSVLYQENIAGHGLADELRSIISEAAAEEAIPLHKAPDGTGSAGHEYGLKPSPPAANIAGLHDLSVQAANIAGHTRPASASAAYISVLPKPSEASDNPGIPGSPCKRALPPALRDALNRAWAVSAVYKHPSFASENEVRLLVSPFDRGYFDVEPQYHISKDRIKKYYPLDLRRMCEKAGRDIEELVLELIIGPESTQSLPILKDYLISHGYRTLAEHISYSRCPLRRTGL